MTPTSKAYMPCLLATIIKWWHTIAWDRRQTMMVVAKHNLENSDIRTRPIWKTKTKTLVTTNDLLIKEILEHNVHNH